MRASNACCSTSPDFANSQLQYDIGNATKTFQLFIYEVSDESLCDALLGLHTKGVAVELLVSQRINSDYSCQEAKVCYERLYDAGVSIRKTADYYTFSCVASV